MKKLVLLLALLPVLAMAQPDVIASGGGYGESSSVKMSYTIGQTVTATVSGNNAIVTQGFQQPEYVIVKVDETGSDIELNIYPNPTVSDVTLDFTKMPKSDVNIYLYNDAGKVIVNDKISNTHYSLKMKNYSSGVYFLKVTAESSKKTYKIIKK